jgi:hypothetical protein
MPVDKPDDEADDLHRAFERLEAKWNAPNDQRLAKWRDEYCRLSSAERQAFRQWVEQLASAKFPFGIPLHASAKVSILIPEGEENRELVAKAKTLVEAIQAWDQGQEFLPGVCDF